MKHFLVLLLSVTLASTSVSAASNSTPKPTSTVKSTTISTPKPSIKVTANPSIKATKKPSSKASKKPNPSGAPIVKAADCSKSKIVSVKIAAEGIFSVVDGVTPGSKPKLAVKVGTALLILFDADTAFTAKLPGTATPSFNGAKGRSAVCVSANQLGKVLFTIDKTGFVELTVSK